MSENPPTAAVIDLGELRDFFENDLEIIRSLTEIFVDQSDALLPELRSACEKEEVDRVHELAHKLSGSAANMRAAALHSVARDLEQSCRKAGHAEALLEGFARIERAYVSAREALQAIEA